MTGFFNALSASVVLLMLMLVGYFMGHVGWMGAQEKRFVSKYIVNIAVPCNCIVGVMGNLDRASLFQAGIMLIVALVGMGSMLLLSLVLVKILRLPREQQGVFINMTAFSNTVFIGIPVCTQLFGEASMPYVMLYYMINTTYVQLIGVSFLERSGTGAKGKFTVAGFLKGLLNKPPIVAILAVLLLLLLDIRLPNLVMRFAGYIGDSVSPLALIYCGYVIYELGLRNMRFMRGLPTMLVVRLGVAPIICWSVCRFFGISGLAMSVFVVESSLPVASQVPVLAGAYGADERYAATGACLSTLLNMITLPILMLLIG